ncbi:MAG: sulfatase [Cyclobacteriaceae bacterium]
MFKSKYPISIYLFLILLGCVTKSSNKPTEKYNVLFIMVDDLNDNIGILGGHVQTSTPNMDKLAQSGATFTNAHTNAPMCGPSRASLFTGVYPHQSNNYFQAPWFKNEVLSNTRTMMEQFKEAGYNVIGTGKIMHHNQKHLWTSFQNPADYSPTPFDGEKQVPHPDVPAPFSEIGWVDGSLGPFVNLEGRTSSEGKPIQWTTGNPRIGFKPMRYFNDDDRDPTPDEINAQWAADKIKQLDHENLEQPFFMAVGFLRPHTPLVAPQKYFDRFPLEELELSVIKPSDDEDTHLTVSFQGDLFTLKMGKRMFNAISESYGSMELGLKKWTQAYLACVAAVDDNIGQVLDALNKSSLKENTIVVLASDHGFHMGEKDYLYKNSLWEESTRVPLMMRVPGITKSNSTIDQVVSLVDVYPTLQDLCGLSLQTTKNEKGHELDGTSMLSLLKNPSSDWKGAPAALTVVYAGNDHKDDPTMQHYAIRTNQHRYILYNSGKEELYDHEKDPNEWNNLASIDKNALLIMRQHLKEMVSPVELVGFSKTNKL